MMFFWTAVSLRVLANPVANAAQKWLAQRGIEPPVVITLAHLLLTLVCLPLVRASSMTDRVGFAANLTAAVVLAVACNTVLVYAMRLDDLSILGPINAFKSVISLLPAWLLLGERLNIAEIAGIALIVAGSLGLVGRTAGPIRFALWNGLFRRPGVQLRIVALVLSATEAVFLKRALAVSDPTTTFVWWSIGGALGAGLAVSRFLPAAACREQAIRCRTNIPAILLLALATGCMQAATLFVLAAKPVAAALALFQLSSVLSVWLGHRLFAEPHVWRRLLGSIVMAVGAAIIVLARGFQMP